MLSVILLLSVLHFNRATSNQPQFVSRSGRIEGRVEYVHDTAVDVFKGIPFAQPPVGELRWASPKQEGNWKGVKIAESFQNACMQSSNAMTKVYPVNISEDCLYLNVYRPHNYNLSKPLPVMLFFHGGSYVYGAASFIPYEAAERIAKNPDVIIVTANYRLQSLGYLGGDLLREKTGEYKNTTGNWGLLDQRAAMKWVKENAAFFGGNATKVTIFGESAGAGSVSCHMAAKGSWEYFNHAIMESGPIAASWVSLPLVNANNALQQVSELVGCNTNLSSTSFLRCMRSVPAVKLIAAGRHAKPGNPGGDGVIDFAPVVDGIVLVESPYSALKNKNIHQIPVMLGTNRDEGTEFVNENRVSDQAGYKAWAETKFGPDLAAKVMKTYPISNFANPWKAAVAAFGDEAMSCPARETARLLSDAGVNAYLYYLTHELKVINLFDEKIGVFHGTDLIYVFGKSIALWGNEDETIASAFGDWWTSFATFGAPITSINGHNVEWTPYSRANDNHLNVDSTSTMKSGLKKSYCDFWDENPLPYFSLLKPDHMGGNLMDIFHQNV